MFIDLIRRREFIILDEREYQYWTQQVKQVVPIKEGAFEDYNNWHNRALLGRLLANMNIYEPALELMESILEEAKAEDEEHYIWALSDMANYHWVSKEETEIAYNLIDQAIESMNHIQKTTFPLINKGFLFNQKWQIRALTGESISLIEEIENIIHHQLEEKENQSQSLLFYAYFNLALFSYEKDNLERAIALLTEAYQYSNVSEEDVRKILDDNITVQEKVVQLLSLTHRSMVFDS